MQKFKMYFNKYNWILTVILGMMMGNLSEMFSGEWWFMLLLFTYGIILGRVQENERK